MDSISQWLFTWWQILKERLLNGYSVRSYGNDGIDLILEAELLNVKDVFFVDVGANHPFWSSNSYLLYKKGASGINIDATPGIMESFKMARPRDINLELAISNSKKAMNYLVFNFSAYNGFEETIDQKRMPHVVLKEKVKIVPMRLSQVLDKYLPPKQNFSVLLIDTEGHDLEVLNSNDWKKYVPKYIVTEYSFLPLVEKLKTSAVYKYLTARGYEIIACTQTNLLFKLKKTK